MPKANKIAEQIKGLVDELVALSSENSVNNSKKEKTLSLTSNHKGASGALVMLTDEGFFDSPRSIAVIMDKLKEVGRHYPQTTVSMNLLNLVKRRTFTRLMDKETKNWLYVLRK